MNEKVFLFQLHHLLLIKISNNNSNESIRKHRTWEDASQPVWVEGYAKFHYFGNQWVQLWNQSGGVRSKIKNNKLTVSLY